MVKFISMFRIFNFLSKILGLLVFLYIKISKNRTSYFKNYKVYAQENFIEMKILCNVFIY